MLLDVAPQVGIGYLLARERDMEILVKFCAYVAVGIVDFEVAVEEFSVLAPETDGLGLAEWVEHDHLFLAHVAELDVDCGEVGVCFLEIDERAYTPYRESCQAERRRPS